jgi:hypothetical protein
MGLITLLAILIVVGVALYLVGLIPMDAKILTVIRVVVLLVVILWLLDVFVGIDIPVGHVSRHRL